MQVTRFCPGQGLPLATAVRFIAWYGLVMSAITLLIGFSFLGLPSLLEKFIDMEAGQDLDTRGLIVAAVLIIFFSLLWFTFSFVLRKRSANNDQEGVERMLRLGSIIIGSLFLLPCIGGVIIGLFMIYMFVWSAGVGVGGIIVTAITAAFLAIGSQMIHGIRTNRPKLMRPWIVTQIVLGVLNVIGGVVDTIYHMAYVLGAAYLFFGVTETVFGFLGFLYFGGMVVVHYNLMLAAQENAPTVLADITKVERKEGELGFVNPLAVEEQQPPPYSACTA